jgi:hypothetical protein
VVANAVYGLYLVGSEAWLPGLDLLLRSPGPLRRRSGIWVIQSTQGSAVISRLKPLIRDPDPDVRRAAFGALVALRESAGKWAREPAVIESSAPEMPVAEMVEEETPATPVEEIPVEAEPGDTVVETADSTATG